LVNARYFTDLVRYLPDSDVTVALDKEKSKLQVIYGRSSSSLNIFDDEEFPDLPLTKLTPICKIPQNILRECIKKTAFAAATNHFKPVFTGLLFDFEKDGLKIVASDTHRLAIIKRPEIKTSQKIGQLVIPARNINELFRILEDSENEITMGQAENNIVFYLEEEGFYFLTRLIEGQYPNYNQVVPQEFINSFFIEADPLIESLERASLLPTDAKSIKHVQMDFGQTELMLSAFSEKMGEMNEVIDTVNAETDKTIKINFNTRYMLDIVKILGAENKDIQIKLTGAMSPAIIKNPEEDSYIHVLVPLRTG
ncbi:MAG: DNA polymerase III subunit beta, partial [Ignavibacteriales bacterium]